MEKADSGSSAQVQARDRFDAFVIVDGFVALNRKCGD